MSRIYAKRPCAECPWVLDTPPGQFPAERYEKLRDTTGTRGNEAPLGAPIFACHKSREGGDFACAGWLAAVGWEHLGIRVLVAQGEIPASALEPGEGWPALHSDYEVMAADKGRRG